MKFLSFLLLFCLTAMQPAWGGTLPLRIGGHTLRAEIADTALSRERGLMQRNYLCADCGMLFVFNRADRYSFWMKNTPLALSIAFISADGRILNIENMTPNTTDIHNSRGKALYALEMNRGWFSKNGIKPGTQVNGIKRHP